MKKFLFVFLMILIMTLSACGNSDAIQNYEKCNDELETECTEQEFENWLMEEAEYNKLIPFSELDNTNQNEYLEEVEEQIEEIFGN